MTYSTYYNLFETRTLGIYQAGHPLMEGVTAITDRLVYGADLAIKPDAEAVAYYDNNVPYLATYPGRIVAINQALTDGAEWEGDVPALLHNAILALAPSDVPWLSETVTEFDLAIGGSAHTNITLDASVPQVNQPGIYRAWLWFDHNDPFQQGAYVRWR